MASSDQMIDDVVKRTMSELELRAPIQMHRLRQDQCKYDAVQQAARDVAKEQVTLAKEFENQPEDILDRLKKHLPEKRIQMIQRALEIPTYKVNITKDGDQVYMANFERDGKSFLPPRNLVSMVDIDWTKLVQYGSIIVEAVLLVVSAVGVDVSPSGDTIESTAEDVAHTLQTKSLLRKAVEDFVEAWNKGGAGAYDKAKALFHLIKDSFAAGIFWTVVKSLCSHMKWYDWLEAAAKVTAMVVAALATDGAALIAKIALVVLSAVDFVKKIANVVQLNGIM